MGDMDQNNKFQTTQLCRDANVKVMQHAANRAGHTEHKNVHTMKYREWMDKEIFW